jgi:hypothetical protein
MDTKVTSAGFVSASEVRISSILNGRNYGIENCGVEVTFNGMTSLLNFMKS